MNELNNGSQIDKSCNKENENQNSAQNTAKNLKSDGTLNTATTETEKDKNWIVEINDIEPNNDDDALKKDDAMAINDPDATIPLNINFESMNIDDDKGKLEIDEQPQEDASKCSKRTRRNRKRNAMKKAKKSKKVPVKEIDDPSTAIAIRKKSNQSDEEDEDDDDEAGPSNYAQHSQKTNKRKRSRPDEAGFIQFGIFDIQSLILFEIMNRFFNGGECICENCTEELNTDSDSLDE